MLASCAAASRNRLPKTLEHAKIMSGQRKGTSSLGGNRIMSMVFGILGKAIKTNNLFAYLFCFSREDFSVDQAGLKLTEINLPLFPEY